MASGSTLRHLGFKGSGLVGKKRRDYIGLIWDEIPKHAGLMFHVRVPCCVYRSRLGFYGSLVTGWLLLDPDKNSEVLG